MLVEIIKNTIILTSLVSPAIFAETGFKSGTIKNVRIHNADIPGWEAPIFWFSINGITSAGSCSTWYGDVLFVSDSNQALSMVLATYMSGKELAVHYDDSNLITGTCKAEYITLGNPAPLH